MISYKNLELQKDETQRKGKVKYIIDGNSYFAEESAIKYYKDAGYNALWTENDYWGELMSLIFWNVIFAKVRGAVTERVNGMDIDIDPNNPTFNDRFKFMVEMNGMPSDFFSSEFYLNRKYLIINQIRGLQNRNLKQTITQSYKKNYGKNCRPIEKWDKFSLEQLLIPIGRMSNDTFLKILERLITNFNNNRSGLPDLIVYNDNELFFAEVKSDNDRLSENQKGWHSFLSDELNLKVELFLINHTENKIKRLKSSYDPNYKSVTNAKERSATIQNSKHSNSDPINILDLPKYTQEHTMDYTMTQKSPKTTENNLKSQKMNKTNPKRKKSGCFIATAVYGSSQTYQVQVLKLFRDNYLKKSILGNVFIDIYYNTSPYIVKYIKTHEIMSNLIKMILDKLVNLIERII